MKKKAWGVKQAIWGSDHPENYWFGTKKAREEYMKKHDYCDRLRCQTVETDDQFVQFFETYAEYEEAMKERW